MDSVLVAANPEVMQDRIRACLTREGFSWCEPDPVAAVGHARRLRPVALVLVTPEQVDSSTQVVAAVRNERELTGLPILALSNPGNSEAASRALSAGADDWLPCDVSSELLLARIACLKERHQLRLRLALNQRVAQLGQLATGIVHEIRGPLSVIGGNAEIMLMSLMPETPALQFAEPILRTVRVLQKRLEHLMGAVRSGSPQVEPVEVSDLVHEACHIFQRGTDPRACRINIEYDMPAGLPPVQVDAGRILLVLLNLLSNSHEAVAPLERNTDIKIGARTCDESGRRWVVLEVQDNGPGIPEVHRPRIFEPFFTTKDEGSGYGLYLSEEILRELGGRLSLANTSEHGTTFALWLPVEVAREPGCEPPSETDQTS